MKKILVCLAIGALAFSCKTDTPSVSDSSAGACSMEQGDCDGSGCAEGQSCDGGSCESGGGESCCDSAEKPNVCPVTGKVIE